MNLALPHFLLKWQQVTHFLSFLIAQIHQNLFSFFFQTQTPQNLLFPHFYFFWLRARLPFNVTKIKPKMQSNKAIAFCFILLM